MTLEIHELVIEARIGDSGVVTTGEANRREPLADEALIEEITRRVLCELRRELREMGESRR